MDYGYSKIWVSIWRPLTLGGPVYVSLYVTFLYTVYKYMHHNMVMWVNCLPQVIACEIDPRLVAELQKRVQGT